MIGFRKVSTRRTSSNAWCQNDCYKDPIAQAVMDRIVNLTGIPEVNSEYLQLLKVRLRWLHDEGLN